MTVQNTKKQLSLLNNTNNEEEHMR